MEMFTPFAQAGEAESQQTSLEDATMAEKPFCLQKLASSHLVSVQSCDNSPVLGRLKPGSEVDLAEIEEDIKCKLKEVCWLPNFYYLPPDRRIAGTKAYQEGKIYGIDAASGAAVLALDVSPGDHVLDLCAAPGNVLQLTSLIFSAGAKLCTILDLLGCSGSVTGVDIARHRLAASRTMLLKYALGDLCRLFVADGTTFSLIPSVVKLNCKAGEKENTDTYREWTPRRPWKERKRVAKSRQDNASSEIIDPELIFYGRHSGVVGLNKCEVFKSVNDFEISQFGYDKVLVDAECTHDGSIKHIQKFEQWGWNTLSRRVLDAARTDNLTVLQLRLLTNGFRLLKAGGFLVYSTCSLTVAQNEGVVEQFLSQHVSAELVEIEAAKNWPCRPARLPKTLRFDPLTSSTSGLFIAKFTKLAM
ncbi:hypothetical protein BUALT_Bualt03G0186200 [Buddleja alternifolia]|uniref:SAM-dependent MTase RsmB/NOP-type domain-containing protein n=1 Tax=Buddleja alternifolia TaxID=168488 RepID=A0AAV6Y302_9LAMI|nr:hypothetical protein BUALT_Bualt03G0186200 [Buddleja alternifolia]